MQLLLYRNTKMKNHWLDRDKEIYDRFRLFTKACVRELIKEDKLEVISADELKKIEIDKRFHEFMEMLLRDSVPPKNQPTSPIEETL